MPEDQNTAGKGFAIASLVTGILSLVTIQFIIISIGLALLAIILGIISLNQGKNGLAKAGLVLGIIN